MCIVYQTIIFLNLRNENIYLDIEISIYEY